MLLFILTLVMIGRIFAVLDIVVALVKNCYVNNKFLLKRKNDMLESTFVASFAYITNNDALALYGIGLLPMLNFFSAFIAISTVISFIFVFLSKSGKGLKFFFFILLFV
jgi:hypothetical protein